jgi:hypothetical protein
LSDPDQLVWYVAYGSNLLWSRFRCYLTGGRPDGARRTYVGARDRAEPALVARVQIPGRIVFAGESSVWGGGMAFLYPDAAGSVAARAYLITLEQLNDVVAQEIHQPTGTDLGLQSVLSGGEVSLPNARYDTVAHVGARETRSTSRLPRRRLRICGRSRPGCGRPTAGQRLASRRTSRGLKGWHGAGQSRRSKRWQICPRCRRPQPRIPTRRLRS